MLLHYRAIVGPPAVKLRTQVHVDVFRCLMVVAYLIFFIFTFHRTLFLLNTFYRTLMFLRYSFSHRSCHLEVRTSSHQIPLLLDTYQTLLFLRYSLSHVNDIWKFVSPPTILLGSFLKDTLVLETPTLSSLTTLVESFWMICHLFGYKLLIPLKWFNKHTYGEKYWKSMRF